MTAFFGIILLCLASMVLGRLVLTRDQAWRTIAVRLPALVMLVVATTVMAAFMLLFAAVCFIGGSFYGLNTWWLPTVGRAFEDTIDLINAIISGSWE